MIGLVLMVVVTAVSVATGLLVVGLFVWAARKDGEEDRAIQKQLGHNENIWARLRL